MPLLTPYDALVPSGRGVSLEVEVERSWAPFVDPPLAGAEVSAEGRSAVTDASGLARLDLPARPDGLHRVEVRSASLRATAHVLVLPADAPVFITDIDETISASSPLGFMLKPLGWVRPIPGAAEALAEIARRLPLLYLTARDHRYTGKTKRWLSLKGFPEAPVYLRKGTRFTAVRARHHKIARLAELKRDFPRISWGVGDKAGDVEAYLSAGIRPVCFGASRPPGVPESVPCLDDWNAIRDRVLK
jgi:phosphatidate phosphatase APP1